MKNAWLVMLLCLLFMQSTDALVEVHQTHEMSTSQTHAQFDHQHEKTSISHNDSHTESVFDCHHCCHCHKVKPFDPSPTRPQASPLAYHAMFVDPDELILTKPQTALFRPPKLYS